MKKLLTLAIPVSLFLVAEILADDPVPTPWWINAFCERPFLDSVPLTEGDIITAYDPDSVLCGKDTIREDGSYGFMPIYRDDPFSEEDEGAEPGDLITFAINGREVSSDPLVYWTSNGNMAEVCQFSTVSAVHTVRFDIKPGSCPNPLNAKAPRESMGVLPVAILGSENFDVVDVDAATVVLEGISPLRWNYEDVGTPIEDSAEKCSCTSDRQDGFMDMTFKFRRSMILDALGSVYDGESVPLKITGQLFNGNVFEGSDCVVIRGDKEGRDKDSVVAIPINGSPKAVLRGNFPNPFNPTTEIGFSLPTATHVKLDVFNVMGQMVATLIDKQLEAGEHTVLWNSGDAASGVYLYRLQADDFVEIKKMLLLK